MSEFKDSIYTPEQYQLVTDKRSALEKLINIATGVHDQQIALNNLSIATRPSQNFPEKSAKYLKIITRHLGDDSVEDIVKKLDIIEAIIQKALVQILHFTGIDVNSLRDNQIKNIDIEFFSKFIDNFKRRTETSLALRYVLHQRGVAIAPCKLHISQGEIREQVVLLKQKEQQCVEQIKLEINTIIHDTCLIITQTGISDEIKNELANVHQAMLINLEHLNNGGSITEIPNVFEIITLQLESPTDESNTSNGDAPSDNRESSDNNTVLPTEASASEKQDTGPDHKPGKISFWRHVKIWLTSSWSTSWSSIKKQHQNRDIEKYPISICGD